MAWNTHSLPDDLCDASCSSISFRQAPKTALFTIVLSAIEVLQPAWDSLYEFILDISFDGLGGYTFIS